MNKYIPSLISILVLLVGTFEADAQCRRFARQRVISTLDDGQIIGQITSGTIGRGESAATVLEIDQSGPVDLILSTHNDLGNVTYSVVDTRGTVYGEGQVRGAQERISIDVEQDTDLIVHIESEKRSASAYTPIARGPRHHPRPRRNQRIRSSDQRIMMRFPDP